MDSIDYTYIIAKDKSLFYLQVSGLHDNTESMYDNNRSDIMNELISWQGLTNIIWLIFLLAVFRYFWRQRQISSKACDWLITRGRITQLVWTKDGATIWPKIEYTYQIYDRDFTSDRFFFDTSHNSPYSKSCRNIAYRMAIAFENNEDIDVFYDPDNPLQAVLDVSIPSKLNVIINFLLLLIIAHVLMMVLGW